MSLAGNAWQEPEGVGQYPFGTPQPNTGMHMLEITAQISGELSLLDHARWISCARQKFRYPVAILDAVYNAAIRDASRKGEQWRHRTTQTTKSFMTR